MEIEFLVNTCSLLFLSFLTIVYFTKKNALNIENKIYRIMVITNLLFLILQIGTKFVYELNPKYYLPYCNIPLSIILIWFYNFAFYILVVSNEKNQKIKDFFNKNKNKIEISVVIYLVIIIIIQLILPSSIIYGENNEVLAIIGPNTYFVYGNFIFGMSISLYSIIKNRKTLNKKKLSPFLAIFGFALLMLVFEYVMGANPGIYLFFSLITYFMYHTIENPDLRLINELKLAKEQAEKSNNAKSDFLSSMSHEIRTPLNAIVGLSQMIAEGDDMKQMRSDSKDILIASQNLLEIVNGILDINKLEANKIEVVDVDYNLRKEFDNVIKMIKIRIGEKPIELRTNFSNNLPENLYGDSTKLKQILTNLLTNAVKYTEKGYIDLNVDCLYEKNKCNLLFSVTDTGRGIKEEQIPKLFTKFNRLEEDKDTDIEGTGLGLAITKSLIDLLNGKIEVQSTYGVGSTFKVMLPQKISKISNVTSNNTETEELI